MASKVILDEYELYERIAVAEIINYDPGVLDTAMQEQIRIAHAGEFPSIGYFEQLHKDGKLNEPLHVAAHLARLISERIHSDKFNTMQFPGFESQSDRLK